MNIRQKLFNLDTNTFLYTCEAADAVQEAALTAINKSTTAALAMADRHWPSPTGLTDRRAPSRPSCCSAGGLPERSCVCVPVLDPDPQREGDPA